jgi:glycosyltransferase involved in cell wall biosynthesis
MIEAIALPEPIGETPCEDGVSHVLLLIDELSRTLGGGERVVLQLAAQLPRYGFAPSVLTFSAHPKSAALQFPPCPIYLLPLHCSFDAKAVRAAFELRALLKQDRIRLVHTFFGSADLWGGLVTKLMSDAKLVWALRDMGFLRTRKQRFAYRLLADLPDAVFAVSEKVRQHSIEVDRMQATRIETVYNGVSLSAWPSASFPENRFGEFRVSTVGNIRRIKGHDLFIQAAAIVTRRFPSAMFTIGGDVLEADYFVELGQMVEELGLTKQFRFDGPIADVRQYLAEADVFVLPSRSEGFSNAIIEAMAASLPVVATDVGGNGEAVANGINGFLVPHDDPELLSNAISRLLSDPIKARAMGYSGRKIVEQRFTTETMMQQITGAYRRLLSQR